MSVIQGHQRAFAEQGNMLCITRRNGLNSLIISLTNDMTDNLSDLLMLSK